MNLDRSFRNLSSYKRTSFFDKIFQTFTEVLVSLTYSSHFPFTTTDDDTDFALGSKFNRHFYEKCSCGHRFRSTDFVLVSFSRREDDLNVSGINIAKKYSFRPWDPRYAYTFWTSLEYKYKYIIYMYTNSAAKNSIFQPTRIWGKGSRPCYEKCILSGLVRLLHSSIANVNACTINRCARETNVMFEVLSLLERPE